MRVADARRAIVRRQSLFHIPQRRVRAQPVYSAKFWYKIWDPVLREAARLEYDDLLRPPPVRTSDGTRIDG